MYIFVSSKFVRLPREFSLRSFLISTKPTFECELLLSVEDVVEHRVDGPEVPVVLYFRQDLLETVVDLHFLLELRVEDCLDGVVVYTALGFDHMHRMQFKAF